MKRQFTVMILIEEQDVDEEGDVLIVSEAHEPITLASFDTLAEAEEYLSGIRECVEA